MHEMLAILFVKFNVLAEGKSIFNSNIYVEDNFLNDFRFSFDLSCNCVIYDRIKKSELLCFFLLMLGQL